jgi:hypothetical protein
MRYCFGKQPARHDARTLALPAYFTPALPPPPPSCDWSANVPAFGMSLNDRLGDCAIAAPAHQAMAWSDSAGKPLVITDAAVLKAYRAVSGYNPNDPSTDVGCNELDVLKYLIKTGIGGHKILAYADVSIGQKVAMQQSVALLGGAYIGIACPAWLVALLDNGGAIPSVWDMKPGQEPDPNAGHAIEVVAYKPDPKFGMLWGAVSWGQVYWLTDRCIAACCDEWHAMVSTDFLTATGNSPVGLDVAGMEADAKALQTA